jgi:hypothetical protein
LLDGVVLNALHSVDKEFVKKGTLRTFKASDDEKFQISSDHFNQFCTPPHLDENDYQRGLYFKGGNRWVVEAGNLNLNSGKC